MFTALKVNSRIETVRVPYYGVYIDVPSASDIVCITVSKNGMVYGWICQPEACTEFGDWTCSIPGQFLGTLSYNGDWKESLVYVSESVKQLLSRTPQFKYTIKQEAKCQN